MGAVALAPERVGGHAHHSLSLPGPLRARAPGGVRGAWAFVLAILSTLVVRKRVSPLSTLILVIWDYYSHYRMCVTRAMFFAHNEHLDFAFARHTLDNQHICARSIC